MKRTNYLSWDQYFMGIAKLSAMRSKDPHTSVGACIVGRITKFYQLAIMACHKDAPMIFIHGTATVTTRCRLNIYMSATRN